jgi:hypothetical protein
MNNTIRSLRILGLLAALLWTVPSDAQGLVQDPELGIEFRSGEPGARDGEEEKEPFELPYDLGVTLQTGLSSSAGNLRPGVPETQTSDSLLNTWGLTVGKGFENEMRLALAWGFYKYLTQYGGLNGLNEARINDLTLAWSTGPIYVIPRADISISGSVGLVAPLSRMSRTTTLRTAISPSLSLSRSFGNFSVGASIGGSKRFHRFTSSVVDAGDVEALRREGGAEDISANLVAIAGVNSEWSFSTGLNMSYRWFKGFTTSLAWNYGRSWAYDVTPSQCDDLSSPFARCDGRIARDQMVGAISVNYAFRDYFSVGASATTAQQPKTADNRRINFPFWDLNTPGLLYTTLGVNFSASL